MNEKLTFIAATVTAVAACNKWKDEEKESYQCQDNKLLSNLPSSRHLKIHNI